MQESNAAEQSGNKEPRNLFEPFQGRDEKYSSTSWEGIRISKSGGKMIQCLSLHTEHDWFNFIPSIQSAVFSHSEAQRFCFFLSAFARLETVIILSPST